MIKKKVLVVDDEPDFLDLVKWRLQSNEYDVITAASGNDALRMVKSDKPDVVLLDIFMPGIDGLEVLGRIRKIDKDLPVFIVTAFSSNERMALANKLNASGFIVKTSDLKKELDGIKSALSLASKYKAGQRRPK